MWGIYFGLVGIYKEWYDSRAKNWSHLMITGLQLWWCVLAVISFSDIFLIKYSLDKEDVATPTGGSVLCCLWNNVCQPIP